METRGSVLLGSAVALAAAGLLGVDGVLMALGASAGMLLLLCWGLGWLNLRKLQVEVEMPRVVQAGNSVRMAVELGNPRVLLDAFGLGLEIRAPGGLVTEGQVPWVPAGSGADTELRESVPSRGHGEWIECSLFSRFPLGLFSFSQVHRLRHSLVVLPQALVPREMVAFGSALEIEPQRNAVKSEAVGEPRGLRDHQAGDSAKLIAWPASLRSLARGGGLMVRELDPPGFHPRKVVVVFHSFGKDGALIRPDRFERAISLLWGAVRHFQASAVPVVLVADFDDWVPRRVVTRRQLGEVGEMLARAERADATEEHELLGRLGELNGDEALVMISDMPTSHWRDHVGKRRRMLMIDVADHEGSRMGRSRRA